MERRDSYRMKTTRRISARVPATPIDVTVLDLSSTGCMIQIDHSAPIAARTTILLALAQHEDIAGEVVWRKRDRAGVQFHERIAVEQLLAMLKSDSPAGDQAQLTDGFGRPLPPFPGKIRYG